MTGFLIFLLGGSILLFFMETGDVVRYFGNHRTPALDQFFIWATRAGEEIPYFLVLFIFLFIRFAFALWVPLVGLTVSLVSFALKSLFAHPRPINFFTDNDLLDTVIFVENLHTVTGMNSFPSGHTMSAFTIFAFTAFCLRQKKGVAVALLLLAILVAVSRVYLVHHFWKDVVFGGLVGVLLAMILYALMDRYILRKPGHPLNRSLLNRRQVQKA
ncbi:MAG: phosphatase PAP2 family protein [Bacteroidota bacterium]